MSGLVFTVFVRSYCHLCEDMLAALQPLREQWGFELEVIDIDGNSSLEEQYGTKIPVLRAADVEICHYFLDQSALAQYIETH